MKPLLLEAGGFHHGGFHHTTGGFHHSSGGFFHSTPNKLPMRKRTVSADSGCDVGHESPDASVELLEETVNQWSTRLENVIHQEVLKAREISEETKQKFYIADTDVRETVVANWRVRIQDLLNLTLDLIECVNNDIKIGMLDSPESGRSFRSDSPLPEEDEPPEDEEEAKEEEDVKDISHPGIQSFPTSKVGRRHRREKYGFSQGYISQHQENEESLDREVINSMGEEDLSKRVMYPLSKAGRRRVRKRLGMKKAFPAKYKRQTRSKKKTIKKSKRDVEKVYNQLKEAEEEQWRATRFSPIKDDFSSKLKMFQSVLDPEDILEDWKWNLKEQPEEPEVIFADWKHNLKEIQQAEDVFQDWKWNLKEHLEPADIFHAWKWNLKEHVAAEDIFHAWKWNLKETQEVENIFYTWKWNLKETQEVEDLFYIWKWNLKEEIEAEDVFATWKWNLKEEVEPEEAFDAWKWNLKESEFIEDIFSKFKWNFQEVEEVEDIFKKFKWNFKDFEEVEDIFSSWKSNLDEPDTQDWTQWKLWNIFGTVKEILANTEEASMSPFWHDFGTVEDILANTEAAWNDLEADPATVYKEDGTEDEWNLFWNNFWNTSTEEDWTQWKFWNSFGSVKEILENTEEAMLSSFWFEFGSVEEILRNTLEAEVAKDATAEDQKSCLANPFVAKVYNEEIDDGCLGDTDEEFNSVLNGRRKTYARRSSLTKDKSDSRRSSAGSLEDHYTWLSLAGLPLDGRKRKRPNDEDEGSWLGKTLEKKLFGEEAYVKQLMMKPTPVVFCRGACKMTATEKKMAAELTFWENTAREVDDDIKRQEKSLKKPRDDSDEGFGGELIFWENSSRDDDSDLINWGEDDVTFIIQTAKNNNNICLSCMEEYKKRPQYLERGDSQHVRRRLFEEEGAGEEEVEDNTAADALWKVHKDPLGPLWVDVEEDDPVTQARLHGTPPKLAIATDRQGHRKRARSSTALSNKLKKIDETDIDDAFWEIEQKCKPRSLYKEIENLPFWDSPDVFTDACDQIESSINYNSCFQGNKDPVNIFRAWRFIFNEPLVPASKELKQEKEMLAIDDSTANELVEISSDLEDAFGEWATQAIADDRANRHWKTRGRRRSKNHEKKRENNDRALVVRPGTPTVTAVTTLSPPRHHHHSWIKTNPFEKLPAKHSCRRSSRANQRTNPMLFTKQPRPRKL